MSGAGYNLKNVSELYVWVGVTNVNGLYAVKNRVSVWNSCCW